MEEVSFLGIMLSGFVVVELRDGCLFNAMQFVRHDDRSIIARRTKDSFVAMSKCASHLWHNIETNSGLIARNTLCNAAIVHKGKYGTPLVWVVTVFREREREREREII